jgi:membrane glycosyltransferase
MNAVASGQPPAPQSASQSPRPGRSLRGSLRVFGFYSLAIVLAGVAALLFADLLWRFGWSTSRTVLLVLFTALFLLASIGCMHAIYGFLQRRVGGGRRITSLGDFRGRSIEGVSSAIIIPVYHEDARRVFEGIRAIYESLEQTGHLAGFDFFILSDSTDADKWIEEERRWFELASSLGAVGRIFYRRRPFNEGKKSGNVRDFLSAWGSRYRYFVVLDADSVMAGATIVDLVKLMEEHPTTGLIQTAPALVNAQSAFGRMQQFANRLYGPVFSAGLNYWAQDAGNYWGHNAIIRTEPFMRFCDLPQLPGGKPFGGHILSHDFVEAALLRKENWEVWFAWDLEGSFEEGPPGIIENAQRDRRWCQGNLQHSLLLFASGLRSVSRIHLAQGILGYLSGPLWLLFMLTATYILTYRERSGLSDIVVPGFTPFVDLTAAQHALLVFGLVLAVIFLPKVLSLLDLALDPARRKAFGGMARASAGAALETVFSTLHAPVQMLFHTKFVVASLLGATVRWSAQNRGSDGTTWSLAFRSHASHTLAGVAWGGLLWWVEPLAFWWFLPIFLGLVLSIPLSVLTSRERLGRALRKRGLFVTPEESVPPRELARLRERMARPNERAELPDGLRTVILDPYVNAVHVTLLREKAGDAAASGLRNEGERLLAEGPAALSHEQIAAILADAATLSWLHREVWTRPDDKLSAWWRAPETGVGSKTRQDLPGPSAAAAPERAESPPSAAV